MPRTGRRVGYLLLSNNLTWPIVVLDKIACDEEKKLIMAVLACQWGV